MKLNHCASECKVAEKLSSGKCKLSEWSVIAVRYLLPRSHFTYTSISGQENCESSDICCIKASILTWQTHTYRQTLGIHSSRPYQSEHRNSLILQRTAWCGVVFCGVVWCGVAVSMFCYSAFLVRTELKEIQRKECFPICGPWHRHRIQFEYIVSND